MKNSSIQKRWYHATTKKVWKKIQKSGVLWGGEDVFLARDKNDLLRMSRDGHPWNGDMHHYELLLSVKYIPNGVDDDYDPRSWEMRVRKPILTENVRYLHSI